MRFFDSILFFLFKIKIDIPQNEGANLHKTYEKILLLRFEKSKSMAEIKFIKAVFYAKTKKILRGLGRAHLRRV